MNPDSFSYKGHSVAIRNLYGSVHSIEITHEENHERLEVEPRSGTQLNCANFAIEFIDAVQGRGK